MTNNALIVGLMAGLLLSSCLQEDPQKKPFTSYGPVLLTDGWQLSTPAAEGIDADSLTSIYRAIQNDPSRYWQVRSMTVIRNSKLVAESYFKNADDRTDRRPIWSCTKQVVGLLVGIALDQKLIQSVDDPINKYIPDKLTGYPDKRAITIRHLLTMQSGIGFENYGLTSDDASLLQQKPDQLLEFVLSRPMATQPGARYAYKDSDPQLLVAVLERVTGKPTHVWADEVLFSKLGLTNYEWTTYRDGATIGAFGLRMPPRELAKIALCVMNKGKANGEQVVSQAWIDEMTREQVRLSEEQSFGYLWWSYPARGIAYMSGNGGQFAMLLPAKKLVVVFTAEDKTQGAFRFSTPNARYFRERIAQVSR